MIRAGSAADVPQLAAVERSAGSLFDDAGMPGLADPLPAERLLEYARDGRLWVATRWTHVVGYALADVVDGVTHLTQLSVRRDAQRHGHGRGLVRAVGRWRGGPMTLTTYRDVPWNAPLYERLGFRVLAEDELTAGVRALRAQEAQLGLDRWPRVAMRADEPPPAALL